MEGHSPLKPPKTYEEQVTLLKSRGLEVASEKAALEILQNVNYYRFSTYLLPFRAADSEQLVIGTSFDKVYAIYEFDRRFRNLMIASLEPIEILLRTRIAYYHAHAYGADGYTNPAYFENCSRHEGLVKEFGEIIERNPRDLVIRHHKERYGGRFPLWVAVEFFSFGMLSRFYANLKAVDRKQVAQELGLGPEHLRSWLACLAYLRNICAHYGRLYHKNLTLLPRLPKGRFIATSNKVFDIVYTMKHLYPDPTKWKSSIVAQLVALVTGYEESIDLSCIGFPDDWYRLLT